MMFWRYWVTVFNFTLYFTDYSWSISVERISARSKHGFLSRERGNLIIPVRICTTLRTFEPLDCSTIYSYSAMLPPSLLSSSSSSSSYHPKLTLSYTTLHFTTLHHMPLPQHFISSYLIISFIVSIQQHQLSIDQDDDSKVNSYEKLIHSKINS